MVAVSQEAAALDGQAGPGSAGWLPHLLHTWRVVAPASFAALAVVFALLPGLPPEFQYPTLLVLAVLLGAGTELAAAVPGSRFGPPGYGGFLWIVPSGAVLAAGLWLLAGPRASWIAAFVLALAVSAVVCIQAVEVRGPEPLRGAAHAIVIGCGFALGLPAYTVAAATRPLPALALTALVTAALALVVLRRPQASLPSMAGYASLTALIVCEIGAVLRVAPLSPAMVAGFTLLALYAVSTMCHALLDRAGPRAYVEVAVVTATVAVAAGLLLARA